MHFFAQPEQRCMPAELTCFKQADRIQHDKTHPIRQVAEVGGEGELIALECRQFRRFGVLIRMLMANPIRCYTDYAALFKTLCLAQV